MVYKLASEDAYDQTSSMSLDRAEGARTGARRQESSGRSLRRSRNIAESGLLIALIKLAMFVYDLITFPIYFLIQRPDKSLRQAEQIRSERVDFNTWIATNAPDANLSKTFCSRKATEAQRPKFMGSTLDEIFARAVQDYATRACLGYRALVTCPVLALNEKGQQVLQDKSFRSDYTWYTYEQVGRRVQDIASGLYHHGLRPCSKALLVANTSLEWFCAAQACFQLNSRIVVFASEVENKKSLRLICEESECDFVFTTCDRLLKLCQLLEEIRGSSPSSDQARCATLVKKIVLIDWLFPVDFAEPSFKALQQLLVEPGQLISIGQVEELGVENPVELRCSGSLAGECLEQMADKFPGVEPNLRQRPQSGSSWTSAHSPALSFKSSGRPTREASIANNNANQNRHCSGQSHGRLLVEPPAAEELAMVVYTHGALGQLKAMRLSHEYLARRCNQSLFLNSIIDQDDIHCACMSLDNVLEFMTEMRVFSRGGSIGYSCNQNTLFYDGQDLFKRDKSDLEALNPTFLLLRPYRLEQLRNSVHNYMSLNMNPIVSGLIVNVLYEYKRHWSLRHFATPLVDRLFCSKLRRLFGSNFKYILCDGTTDCSETKDFFAYLLNVPVIELYGPDEALVSLISVNNTWDNRRHVGESAATPAGIRSGRWWRWVDNVSSLEDADLMESNDDKLCQEAKTGSVYYVDLQLLPETVNRNTFEVDSSRNLLVESSVLCPARGTRVKLVPWEDFRTSDSPHPRGRLVIGGEVVCNGYYKQSKLTKDLFSTDSNGIRWFRTDDIARVFPNGTLEIISAISDMIKMSDGQFISLSQIEHIMRNSQFVDNVCVLCRDDRKLVVALVVPNLRCLALKSPGQANLKMPIPVEPEPDELIDVEFRREVCNDRLLCEFVGKHLAELLHRAGLRKVTSAIHLVPEMWTPESELVTPAFEPKRQAIQKYYADDIQSIFRLQSSGKRLSASRLTRQRNLSSPRFGRAMQLSLSQISH